MFFRTHTKMVIGRVVFALSLCVAPLALFGCAGENQFTSTPQIRFDSPKYQCLKQADETFDLFIEGQLPAQELAAFWNCLDSAVVQFVKFVRGREGQNYSPIEIAKFVDDFFLDQRGLIQQKVLIAEMMHVKRLFLGGSLERVSYEDLFVRTRALLRDFKDVTLELNPHMKALYGSLSGHLDGVNSQEVQSALEALQGINHRLTKIMKKSNSTYSFSHLQALLTQMEVFMQERNPDFNMDAVKKYLPLFSEVKGLVVAPPEDLVQTEDWGRLLEATFNVVGWGVKYRFYIENKDWSKGEAFDALSFIITSLLHELDQGLLTQKGKQFSFVNLDRVMDQLAALDFLPLDIDAPTAKAVLRKLAERVLDPQSGPVTGWNEGDLQALRYEFKRWIDAQYYIYRELTMENRFDQAGVEAKVKAQAEVVEAGAEFKVAAEVEDAGSEMRLLMLTRWPLLRDEKGRLIFSKATFQGRYDGKSLTTLNWQRALMRALMRGYAKQTGADGATGLTRNDLVILFNDWHELAENLGLFDPGAGESMAKKIFMEGNLFMPSSNGDDRFDFIEAVQYLAFAVSGLQTSGDIVDNIGSICATNEPKKFAAACVSEQLFVQRDQIFENLPLMLQFIGSQKEKWAKFHNMLETATRDGDLSQPIGRGEIIEMVVLMHYIETFYATYDTKDNQRIDVDETLQSFPVFRLSLKEIVKSSFGISMGNDELKGLLTYLFRYGEPPQSSVGGAIKFLHWLWHPESWEYEADRLRVAQILAELNSLR